jgi:hypothetical protein
VYCRQKNICQNHPPPWRFSEKETSGKIGTKQLVSYAQQNTCSLVVKKYFAKHSVTALEHLPYSPDFPLPDFSLSMTKSALKGRFVSAEKVSVNSMTALVEV